MLIKMKGGRILKVKKMKNNILTGLWIIAALFLVQSCEKMEYSDPTHMEDYLKVGEFTPDVVNDAEAMIGWDRLPNDGESKYYPFIYQITGKPGSMIYRKPYGIRFDAYGGWWDQRTVREGFDVNGDFEIEFKMRFVDGTGDDFWQKAGIIIGDTGGDPAKLWLSLENPSEKHLQRVNCYISGAEVEWLRLDEGKFSATEWQVIKAVRTGSTFKVYRNGNEIYTVTNDLIANMNGKVGLSAEALSADFEYVKVNGVVDDFTNMDNWKNLDAIPVMEPSKWEITDEGLNVVARYGLNHRAISDYNVQDFTAEIKIKIDNPNSLNPKAGLMIGELGDGLPKILVGLDLEGGNNSIVKFIDGKTWIKLQSPAGAIDCTQWQLIRVNRIKDELFIYLNDIRIHYEKGDYLYDVNGKLGLLVEGCEADIEYVSIKK